ncbi:MAG TPA: radical SAM protein [Thermoanaerobaculia bacterium]|nr:radical SAM protein [Thermoanaerobaculia bacterium]
MSRQLTVLVDVTERCNLRCVMCYFSTTDRIRFPPFDVEPDGNGNMPVELFAKMAGDFFPKARQVSIGCATEPLMHPQIGEMLGHAGRHGVPEIWMLTNLLPLTEATAAAIAGNITTMSVSIDGVRKETYERIRVGATWERLMAKLQLLREASRRRGPLLRVTFTWMRANRAELRELPEFAADLGAKELDVRYVAETPGADFEAQTLNSEDPRALRDELASTARDAVRRGLRLAAYPEFDARPASLFARIAWRFWRVRAGIDRFEHLGMVRHERATGCRYPDRYYIVRPSGAVFPCHYYDEPIGFAGSDTLLSIAKGPKLSAIRNGLQCGNPAGACATCETRRDALYRAGA